MKCLGNADGKSAVYCDNTERNPLICARCGWEFTEDTRRRQLPLVKGEDGLLRKIVRREN